MARARNIKPGLYKNEDLAECSIWARYLFPGLWTLADREGRMEDRPKRIKAELLPFDSQEVEPLLAELADRGFLVRYQNSDGRFIQISKFSAHQSPHYSEKKSVIKPPTLPETMPDAIALTPGTLPEHSEKTPPIKRGPQPPDSLIPDSLNLSTTVAKATPPPCPHLEIIALYAKHLPACRQPDVSLWNGTRAQHLQARWREKPERQNLEWWDKFFGYIAESDFLTGRVATNSGRKPFQASLDWIIKSENFVKIHEGAYR